MYHFVQYVHIPSTSRPLRCNRGKRIKVRLPGRRCTQTQIANGPITVVQIQLYVGGKTYTHLC